jgi:hypothetical protein
MFPSLPLMTAIQADRERDVERAAREHRMLETTRLESDAPAPVVHPAMSRPARSTGRTERSNGPAAEAV